ncbi:Mur ligase family protein [uncultured Buchnera sp.]|jgi:UDP-N-acetylmuramoyl-tripeptide--D-alanyl-D-alanine ligase|uniref:UDP-N-acetylmuramoyl-tripeptide--D-alanyl-D- alanine ligase n=1 Tax=uncultured Buchnera sp. TaxID=574037 RepID=UPI0025F59584|nr:Mur ligase family protein [uncultured Buchnera sp.]
MIPLSLKKISIITNGQLYGKNLIIHDIVIDTKKITLGCLFIALKGKKFDAHIFIREAINKGCSAVISQKKINCNISYIVVEDTSIALGKIATWIRQKINPKILAITGSCGKTSVKEMTTSILKKNEKTISTTNNLNNHIGVPITLMKLTKQHKYGVIELGANNPGEIHYTSNLVQPNIVLINNIHYSHLEGFKSLLGVSKAKSEILSGLKSQGTVIINLDSHHLSQWKKKIKNKNIFYFSIEKKKKVIFFLLILKSIQIKHILPCAHHLVK